MKKLNLKAVIGKQWDRFKADFIYKPLEERVKIDKSAESTVRRINGFLEKYGSDALNFDFELIRSKGSKHEINGGWLGQVTVPIFDGLEIVNFIKCFANQESYNNAIRAQTQVAYALSDTNLAGLVSQPVFTNSAERILVTPFINGKLLHNSVCKLSGEARVDKLKEVIDSYFEWKGELQGKRLHVERFGHPLVAMQNLLGCKQDDPFMRAMQPLADELHNGPKTLIHGDYHLSNIIENGRYHPIDWESFSLGYEEVDSGKLLAKAQLSPAQWDELMNYFATKQKLVPVDESIRRQWLNRIRQEVFSVGRYIARSDDSPELRPQTIYAYNKLLRTVQTTAQKGFVDASLENSVKMYFEKQALKTLSNEEYENMRDQDPDLHQSFENGDLESLEERATASANSAENEMKRLHKNLYSWPWKKIRRSAVIAGLGLAAVAGSIAGIQQYAKLAGKHEEERLKQNEDFMDRRYESAFKENFRRAIDIINRQSRFGKSSMKEANILGSNYAPDRVLPANDPLVDQLAAKYNFETDFIRQTFYINRFYGLSDSERSNMLYDSINYFEPIGGVGGRFGREVSHDPYKNFEMGLELLADLRNQFREAYRVEKADFAKIIENLRFTFVCSGNKKILEQLQTNDPKSVQETVLDALALKDALIAFYSRYEDQNEGEDNKKMGRVLAYNVLHGTGVDFGSMEYLQNEYFLGDDFAFTKDSPLTKGKIRAIGYENLRQIRDHKFAYEAKHSRKQ